MKWDWIKGIELETQSCRAERVNTPKRFSVKLIRFTVISFIVALLLELFVFNYSSFLAIGKNYNRESLDISEATITGFDKSPNELGVYTATDVRPKIIFKNIGQKVRTLSVDALTENEKRYELVIEMSYTDSTRTVLNPSKKTLKLVPGQEKTKYTSCSYFGNTDTLALTFEVDKGEKIHINGVQVNSRIPFTISFIRILLIVLACTAVYALLRAPSFQQPYQKHNRAQNGAIIVTAVAFFAAICCIFNLYCSPIKDPFEQRSGDQVSQELVDAFENGQVSLMDKPSEALLKMSNPYDYTARVTQKIVSKWDHVLYNGKYYSYYGIAPVLLLFLPYNLLTGYYFPSYLACFIFGLIGSIFLIFAYFAMIRNWFRDTPFHLMLCGLIIVLMSCGVLFCVERPMFYEMEEASGFMFLTAGIFFLFISGILTKRQIHLFALTVSSLCISLAVMSRPTLALYAVALLLWLIYGFRQYHKTCSKKSQTVKYFAASFLPYILLGSVQMVYNYLRFGSVLEYGIRYSLTINDFTHTEFYPEIAFLSFWNFLFCIPMIKTTFPFFSGNIEHWGFNGYYFLDTGNSFGTFWRALPLFSYFAAPCILRRIDRRQKIKTFLLCALPGLLVPVAIILSTWESGHAIRYNIDFAWQMLLLALAIIFYLYHRIQSQPLKRVIVIAMIICTVLSVITNFALVFQSVPGVTNTIFHDRSHTILYYKIARLLEFWY